MADVWVVRAAENGPHRGRQAQVLTHWAGLTREVTLLSVLSWIHRGRGPGSPAALPAERQADRGPAPGFQSCTAPHLGVQRAKLLGRWDRNRESEEPL